MVSSMRDADDVKSACIALVTERSCSPALPWYSCSVASCRTWFFHPWWHLVVLASADSWDAGWHTIHACSPKTNKPISSTRHQAAWRTPHCLRCRTMVKICGCACLGQSKHAGRAEKLSGPGPRSAANETRGRVAVVRLAVAGRIPSVGFPQCCPLTVMMM